MAELGIPHDQQGAKDPDRGFRHFSFHPGDRTGGGVAPGRRITIDSGIVNPELFAGAYDDATVELWQRTRLKDRIQAIVIHEEEEGKSNDHEEALRQAPLTTRPINHEARELLRQMGRGWLGK